MVEVEEATREAEATWAEVEGTSVEADQPQVHITAWHGGTLMLALR